MLQKSHISLLSLCFLMSCQKTETINGYSRDDHGFYYKLLAIGDGVKPPKNTSILCCDAVMKTLSDSVFWDTKHEAVNGLFIPMSSTHQLQGSCQSYFMKMVEGDSVSFLVKPSVFFKEYFNSPIPVFCKNDSLVKLDLKLRQIISNTQFEALKQQQIEDHELQELKKIDDYLKRNRKPLKPNPQGIYVLEKKETHLEPVTDGEKIVIQFQGFYLDGRPIDRATQEMEVIYGTPDQLISGLNSMVGSLKKGESTKIIVPSRLAFGERGSSNGDIAPFTPILYNLKIIDIK